MVQFGKYLLCVLIGFASAAMTFWLNQGARVRFDSEGVALAPYSLYDTNGILDVRRIPGLNNYELSSPYSQLAVLESGADLKGQDNKPDGWYVSILNSSKSPEGDEELGIRAIYEDTDNDFQADDLMVIVGKPDYQQILQLKLHSDGEELVKNSFTIKCKARGLVTYFDWDYDGSVDLIMESDNNDTRSQWIIREHVMCRVTRRLDTAKRTYEVIDNTGTQEIWEWGSSGWMSVNK